MSTLEQLEKYFTKDDITGNLTFKDPEGIIPGFKLIFVEGGEYINCDGKPIELSPFYMAEFLVTQEIYVAVTGKKNPSKFQGINHPVESVSWFDAVDLCNVLNRKIGLPPVCDKGYKFIDSIGKKTEIGNVQGFRLPTDAEWEYAAGGGADNRTIFAGTNNKKELDDYAWYDKNSKEKTHPIGQKKPNQLGLYDMSGNVWEWCYDRYGGYSQQSTINPIGPSNGPRRVMLGGSWDFNADFSSVDYPYGNTPHSKWGHNGFRLLFALEFTSGPGQGG